MNLLTLLVSLACALALILQGGSCLFAEKRPFALAFVDLVGAAIVLFFTFSLLSGETILATEFGAALLQGVWVGRLLKSALVFAAILPAVTWYRIARLNNWRAFFWLTILVGASIGILSASRVHLVNQNDPVALQIYLYDFWWPPMVVWLTTCLVGSALALIKLSQPSLCVGLAAGVTIPLAHFALQHQVLPDTQSRPVWWVIERSAFALAFFWVIPFLWRTVSRRWTLCVVALFGLVAAGFVLYPMSATVQGVVGMIPLLPLIAVVAFLFFAKPPGAADALESDIHAVMRQASEAAPIGRRGGLVLAALLPLIGFCVVDVVSIGSLNRAAAIAIALAAWIGLAERLAEGALDSLPAIVKGGVLQLTVVKRVFNLLAKAAEAPQSAARAVKVFLTGSSGWTVAVKAIVMTLLTVVLITAVTEVLDNRQIVIKSFAWTGPDDAKEDVARAKALAEGLINALGRLRHDLRPEFISAERKSSGEHPTDMRLLAAGGDSSSLETAVAKSDDLKLGNVQVPVGFFVRPIQQLVRSLLGVRIIEGNLWKVDEKRYMVLINSSDGESWREFSDIKIPSVPSCPADKDEAPDTTSVMLDAMALDIASSDPSFINAGLTKNREALSYFRRGLRHVDGEMGSQTVEVQKAVACFREALHQDPKFAPAHYRLGLAMKLDGQPVSAIEEFRASTAANGGFVPAALAEAATRYQLTSLYTHRAAILPWVQGDYQQADEALKLWINIARLPRAAVSDSERRSAYFNICQHQYEFRLRRSDEKWPEYFVPFYFCNRADALTPWLAREAYGSDPIDESTSLNQLGVILDAYRGDPRAMPVEKFPQGWSCTFGSVDEGVLAADGTVPTLLAFGSKTTLSALRYYNKSLAVDSTNVIVRCNAAMASVYLYDDMRLVAALANDAEARVTAAFGYADAATAAARSVDDAGKQPVWKKDIATGFYRRALAEFDAAIALNATHVRALEEYAYTVWRWTVDALDQRTSQTPDRPLLFKAEARARESERLAELWQRQDDKFSASSTLGEILLAQGRTAEAIQRLQELLKAAEQWPSSDEIRWDLAVAKLCASIGKPHDAARKLRREGLTLFDQILDREKIRDARPFTDNPRVLDPDGRLAACPDVADKPPSKPMPFVLRRQNMSEGISCDLNDVSVEVSDGRRRVGGQVVHIWGGGVDARAELHSERAAIISLGRPPRASEGYYFAQLERADGHATSAVVSLRTFDKQPATNCGRTRVNLLFVPLAPPKPPAPATPDGS